MNACPDLPTLYLRDFVDTARIALADVNLGEPDGFTRGVGHVAAGVEALRATLGAELTVAFLRGLADRVASPR